MDQESIRLAQEIKNLRTGEEDDHFWKQLEDDEDVGHNKSELQYIERIVYVLAEGDIAKGKMIYDTVTLTEALRWIINGLEFRNREG